MRALRLVCSLGLLGAACATLPPSEYVPGGEGLPAAARTKYRLVVHRERNGEMAAALRLLGELCHDFPLRLSFHLRRVRVARELSGAEAAASLYDPPPPGVDSERAGVFAQLAIIDEEDLAARKTLLEFAAEREPFEAYWRLALADVEVTSHLHLVERAGRERDLGKVQAAAETSAEAMLILERARQEAETALQLDPTFAEAHLLLGYIATALADLQEEVEQRDRWRDVAHVHYSDALALDAASLPGRLNRAENHLHFGRYGEAVRDLKQAALLAPAQAIVWNNLGYTYHALGQLAAAVASYRIALELDSGNARVRAALSDCLRRQGETEEAMAELERARGDSPDDRALRAEIAFKLGAIHEHEKRYRDAVREYEEHIQLAGSDAAKARSRIRRIYEGAFE